ncbi:TPA: SEC-C metal-binding domain-containing protein [Klebsiella pneumoniae]
MAKIGRNDSCWCGSGKKYKKCHLGREKEKKYRSRRC